MIVLAKLLAVFLAAVAAYPHQKPLQLQQLSSTLAVDDSSSVTTLYAASNDTSFAALLDFHRALVQTRSISYSENNAASLVEAFLTARGFTVRSQPLGDNSGTSDNANRRNLYAVHSRSSRDSNHRRLLITTHLDTVPPYIPYEYDEQNGVIHGRGSNDAKGSLAVQLFSVLQLLESGKIQPDDVAFLFVVGEEVDGDGMAVASQYFLDHNNKHESKEFGWDVAIFGEPTENKLGIGHKGNYIFDLDVYGKTAHSGYPHLGISSNEIIIDFLTQLLQSSDKLPSSNLLGPTTVNIGKLDGGIALNVLPSYSHAAVYFRVADNSQQLLQVVDELLNSTNAKWAKKFPDFKPPSPADQKHNNTQDKGPFVFRSNVALKEPQFLDYKVPGFESIALAFGTDVPGFKLPVTRKYLYGPGSIFSAHSDHEYVTVQELSDSLDGYKKLILWNLENLENLD